jgi:hypothetical protein
VAIILMLVTPRGRTNGVPFAVGRLAVLGTAVLLLAGPADTSTDREPAAPPTRSSGATGSHEPEGGDTASGLGQPSSWRSSIDLVPVAKDRRIPDACWIVGGAA